MLFVEEKWKMERDHLKIDDHRKLAKSGNTIIKNFDRRVYQYVQSSNLSFTCLFHE